MKQSVQMDIVQRNMRPGHITRDGFLGTDVRALTDILTNDDETVKRLGLTHERIASRLQEIRDAGAAGLGCPVLVEDRFEVRVDSIRGCLPCPFGDPGTLAKTLVMVRRLETAQEIRYTDMSVHMIAAHGFYEGRGGAFRLDPTVLADLLDLAPQLNP